MLAVKDAAKCWILSRDNKFHRLWAETKQAFVLKMVLCEYMGIRYLLVLDTTQYPLIRDDIL